ncbi:anti-virulence regulator CigR family protein [Thioalkalivibrio paradoxus]|uniref:Membrane protein n=1 Tax=Thioalkalivibrio paradoxus ARh 1 TaxID=713585 RepID=W0DP73_9GAMM|nr:anti-virulence regulator CigR family protein [Thioalkalivibrio paradoxus]AHE99057.1 membrane protein [Thioalkalivibrio paradoxus ARh 1]
MRSLYLVPALVLVSASVLAQPPAHAPAHGARGGGGPMLQEPRPDIHHDAIRQIFGRHQTAQAAALPPGIRMNLARGKPLPPGLAKRVGDPLARDLPSYPGYHWYLAGNDALLVDAYTRVIVDVIDRVFR